jgi:hypothetical protein
VFRYRLHSPDLGEATYAMMIQPGEEIHLGAGRRFRASSTLFRSRRRTSRRSWGCYWSRRRSGLQEDTPQLPL